MQNPISHNLARLRVASGLSQRQLAALSGVHYSMIGKIEMGLTPNPRTQTIIRLCDALKVTLDQINQTPQSNELTESNRP
jgi:transcriptional regulator with XRE-family HTH domain